MDPAAKLARLLWLLDESSGFLCIWLASDMHRCVLVRLQRRCVLPEAPPIGQSLRAMRALAATRHGAGFARRVVPRAKMPAISSRKRPRASARTLFSRICEENPGEVSFLRQSEIPSVVSDLSFHGARAFSRRKWPTSPMSHRTESLPQAVQGRHGRLDGIRILLADDLPIALELFASVLGQAGALVTRVTNGKAVLDSVASATREGSTYDVVVLDYQMPTMNGALATRSLREAGFRGAIIGLTAGVGVSTSIQWRSSGCNAILPKALGSEVIIARVAALAGRHPSSRW